MVRHCWGELLIISSIVEVDKIKSTRLTQSSPLPYVTHISTSSTLHKTKHKSPMHNLTWVAFLPKRIHSRFHVLSFRHFGRGWRWNDRCDVDDKYVTEVDWAIITWRRCWSVRYHSGTKDDTVVISGPSRRWSSRRRVRGERNEDVVAKGKQASTASAV